MKRITITILAVLVSLALPVSASARPHARLSMARGEAMIRANAMLDQPSRVILSDCHRSGLDVRCWVTESEAHTLIYDNGQPIVETLEGWLTA